MGVVGADLADHGAGRRAQLDGAGVSGSARCDKVARRAPVDRPTESGDATGEPGGVQRTVQRLDRRRPRGPVDGVRSAHGCSGKDHGALGIDPEIGDRCGREFAYDCASRGAFGALSLHDRGTDAADRCEQHDNEYRNDAAEASSASLVRCDPLLEVATFGRCPIEGRIEERLLDVGERRLMSVAPVQSSLQTPSAIQLIVGTAQVVPCIRSVGEVLQHPLTRHIVVEPFPQAGPRANERFVRQFHHLSRRRHQSRLEQPRENAVHVVATEHGAQGHPGAHRLTLRGRVDEAEHDRAQGRALLRKQPVVQLFGRTGNCPVDAATRQVSLDRQRRAFATSPRLRERVREHRERARVAFAVTNEYLDQAAFEPQTACRGRTFDRLSERVTDQPSDEVQAAFGQPTQLHGDAQPAEMVTPHRDHRETAHGCSFDQCVADSGHLQRIPIVEEHGLELVDEHHVRVGA